MLKVWTCVFAFRREWWHLSVPSYWHSPPPHNLQLSISHLSPARCPLMGGIKPSTGLHMLFDSLSGCPPVTALLYLGLGSTRQQHETQYWPAHHSIILSACLPVHLSLPCCAQAWVAPVISIKPSTGLHTTQYPLLSVCLPRPCCTQAWVAPVNGIKPSTGLHITP